MKKKHKALCTVFLVALLVLIWRKKGRANEVSAELDLFEIEYVRRPAECSFPVVWMISSKWTNREAREAIRKSYPKSELEMLGVCRIFLLGVEREFSDLRGSSVANGKASRKKSRPRMEYFLSNRSAGAAGVDKGGARGPADDKPVDEQVADIADDQLEVEKPKLMSDYYKWEVERLRLKSNSAKVKIKKLKARIDGILLQLRVKELREQQQGEAREDIDRRIDNFSMKNIESYAKNLLPDLRDIELDMNDLKSTSGIMGFDVDSLKSKSDAILRKIEKLMGRIFSIELEIDGAESQMANWKVKLANGKVGSAENMENKFKMKCLLLKVEKNAKEVGKLETELERNQMETRSVERKIRAEIERKENVERTGLLRNRLKAKEASLNLSRSAKLVVEESEKSVDILQGNFIDSYRNLTIKHLMGLNFLSKHLPHSSYLIKSDDDIVVDLRKLLALLARNFLGEDEIGGFEMKGTRVERAKNSKWFVDKADFSRDIYPDFLSGWLYFTRKGTIASLLKSVNSVGSLFWIDDVFVTGILRQVAGARVKAVNEMFATDYRYLECCIKGQKEKRKCDYIAGPDGGRLGLHWRFKKFLNYCRLNCRDRTKENSVKNTCVVAFDRGDRLEKGAGIVVPIK